jgi:hypothetical protein
MDYPQSEIRREIESTRAGMVEKISTLEARVGGAIEEIKHLANPKYQVEHRPWLMIGVAVVAGFMTSRLIFARPKPKTAIMYSPDDGTSTRVALGRQSSGFIGGLVSSVAMALAREFAISRLSKRTSPMRDDSERSQTTPRRLH